MRHWQVNGTKVTAQARPVRCRDEFAAWPTPPGCWPATGCGRAGRPRWAGAGGSSLVARRNSGEVLPGLGYVWQGSLADQVEAVVDAELAVLLRLTGFIGDQQAIGYEMRGLTAGVADTSAFDVPPEHTAGARWMAWGSPRPPRAKTAAGVGMEARLPWSADCRSAAQPRLPAFLIPVPPCRSRLCDPGPAPGRPVSPTSLSVLGPLRDQTIGVAIATPFV